MYDDTEKGIDEGTNNHKDTGPERQTERKTKTWPEKDKGKGNTAAKRRRNLGTETKRKIHEETQR